MTNGHKMCTRCIMDTTDPDIQFDNNGVCNHCREYNEKVRRKLHCDEAGQQELNKLVNQIRIKGKNRKYDCVIGVSGGVDSTFVAYLVKKLGLRVLAVHLDNEWNSEVAVSNVKEALEKLDIDLCTSKVDWREFKDLQLSFLRASVPDTEVPTDHAISALLYEVAARERVPFIFTGVNLSTEGIHPIKWGYGLWDWKYIKSVHREFGNIKLKSFPHYSLFRLLYYVYIKRIKRIPILNYVRYVKKEAIDIMKKELNWKCYGGKHYESIYTRFVQAYILPRKFNIDKRKSHLSSLICSGQITREEALREMKRNTYPTEKMMREDRGYVIKNFGLTEEEFERIMYQPIKIFRDYSNNYFLFSKLSFLVNLAKK